MSKGREFQIKGSVWDIKATQNPLDKLYIEPEQIELENDLFLFSTQRPSMLWEVLNAVVLWIPNLWCENVYLCNLSVWVKFIVLIFLLLLFYQESAEVKV